MTAVHIRSLSWSDICPCVPSLRQVFLLGKKTVSDTLCTAKLLLDHGLRELINEPDSLGNTPLHALIAR